MKRRATRPHAVAATLLVALGGLCASSCSAPPQTIALPPGEAIGQPIAPRAALGLATVAAEPSKYLDQTLLVEATVTNVCQSKGCWMQVRDGAAPDGPELMVRWETGCGGQYAFPKDAIGKRVLIQGSFYRKAMSAAEVEHLEGESGGKPVARTGYELNASGVLVVAQ